MNSTSEFTAAPEYGPPPLAHPGRRAHPPTKTPAPPPLQVDKDLRTMLIKPDAPAAKMVGVRVWPRAIPQFNVGHGGKLDQANAGLAAAGWDGVMLGGNYVSGVALGKVVEFGYSFAGQVADKVVAGAPAARQAAAAQR